MRRVKVRKGSTKIKLLVGVFTRLRTRDEGDRFRGVDLEDL